MAQAPFDERIKEAIEKAIETRIEEVRQQIIEETVAKFEKLLRVEVMKVAVASANFYDVTQSAGRLVLTIDIRDKLSRMP